MTLVDASCVSRHSPEAGPELARFTGGASEARDVQRLPQAHPRSRLPCGAPRCHPERDVSWGCQGPGEVPPGGEGRAWVGPRDAGRASRCPPTLRAWPGEARVVRVARRRPGRLCPGVVVRGARAQPCRHPREQAGLGQEPPPQPCPRGVTWPRGWTRAHRIPGAGNDNDFLAQPLVTRRFITAGCGALPHPPPANP